MDGGKTMFLSFWCGDGIGDGFCRCGGGLKLFRGRRLRRLGLCVGGFWKKWGGVSFQTFPLPSSNKPVYLLYFQ